MKKESKRDLIMRVATGLFARRGFENCSVSEICEEADVSKGLIYHHFKNKNDLLREIFATTTARMLEMTPVSDADPLVQIRQLIETLFSQLDSDKQFFQFNLNIMLQPATRSVLQDLIAERSSHLLASTKRIFRKISPENDEVKSYMFVAELDGVALNYLAIFAGYPLQALKNHLLHKYSN